MIRILVLICFAYVTGNPQANCSSKVVRCPLSEEEWQNRSRTFHCTRPRTNYSCIFNANKDLVEVCIAPYPTPQGIEGCPYINFCHEDEAFPVHSSRYFPCEERNGNCPGKDHDMYTFHELYKYTKCILKDESSPVVTGYSISTSTFETSTFGHDFIESDVPKYEWIGIILIFPAVLTTLLLVVYKNLRKRRQRLEQCFKHTKRSIPDHTLPSTEISELKVLLISANNENQGNNDNKQLLDSETSQLSPNSNNDNEETNIKQTYVESDTEYKDNHTDVLEMSMLDINVLTSGKCSSNNEQDNEGKKSSFCHSMGRQNISKDFFSSNGSSYHDKPTLRDFEPGVNILKQKLIERNNKETREIPLSPVTTDGDKLPIEHLFSSVVIREDVKENRKGKKSAQLEEQQEGKEVKSPEDMLTKDGKPVPRVFMLGKAAHGKTTYCKWFLKTWCNSQQPGMSGRPLNKWENALSQFDFVFHIPLRHVDPSRADVTDMICQDILGSDPDLQATAKHVLSSKKYRCFIMMDGLDEWKPDQSVIDRLKYKGMPNIDNMSNCVIFTTMRPWKFSEVEGVTNEDRVIEILGLDDAGIESVIEKVLVHYHEMKPDTAEYKAKCKEIKSKLQNKTVKSFVKIPLLAVVCVQIWYEGRQTRDSMTSFYSELTDMLIERALAKIKYQITENKETEYSLPETLLEKENIVANISILLKLGKVAYNGLLSNKESLEFQKRKLEKEIGKKELQFVLDVGLISEKEAHGITTKNVSVHFFHKSVQEFLAAIYIVTNKEVSDLFCKHLCDIKVIMELSNVIMFICGMCPSLGSVISQSVVSVTDSDTEICKYRESPDDDSDTVEELYKLQVSWLRELEYGQTDSPVTDSPVTFHVSDVYVDDYSDIETVRVTSELLSDHHIYIRSLYLYEVPTDGERSITNTVVNNLLSDPHSTRSLSRVYIDGGDTDRTINKVCGPSLRALRLTGVIVANTNTVPGPVLCQCDRLQRLVLFVVTLGDRDLGLTPNMTLLQEVTLWRVNMTSSGWGRWLQSVIDIHHQFGVILLGTNIDRHTMYTIHSSPHLSVTQDDRFELKLTRVWPLTQDTQ